MATAFSRWLDEATVLSLSALIFTLPFSKSAVEVCFSIALISFALKKIISYKRDMGLLKILKPADTKLNLPIYLFIITGVMSTIFSASIALSLRGFFFKLLEGVLLYFMITETINNGKRLRLILISMLLSMLLISVDGIFQRLTGCDFIRHYYILGWDCPGRIPIYFGRIRASFTNPNGFGGWLAVMIPLVVGITLVNRKSSPKWANKSVLLVLIGIMLICLRCTVSKGAFVGLVFSLIFFALLSRKKILLIVTTVALATLLFVPLKVPSLHCNKVGFEPEIGERAEYNKIPKIFSKEGLLTIKNSIVSAMLKRDGIRTNLWRQAMLIIKDRPVFGCGLNTYSAVAPGYKNPERESGVYCHNSYLQMAAETGFVGLGAFLFLMFTLFRVSIKSIKRMDGGYYSSLLLGLLSGLFGFLVHSFFDVNFYALQLVNFMWFIMGLIIAVQHIALNEGIKPGANNA